MAPADSHAPASVVAVVAGVRVEARSCAPQSLLPATLGLYFPDQSRTKT